MIVFLANFALINIFAGYYFVSNEDLEGKRSKLGEISLVCARAWENK